MTQNGFESSTLGRGIDRLTLTLLLLGGAAALLQALVPLERFIHRGDDAYYYFQVAVNFAQHGFWTFDGLTPTNGVQPLWAWLLTIVATVAQSLGLTEKVLLSRVLVAITAIVHVASAVGLALLISRLVSMGTGVVAGGALLFSIGTVSWHTWGMENSVYALALVTTLTYYQFSFSAAPTTRRAVVLGVLLGVTALSRLNAVLLTGFVALAIVAAHLRTLQRRAIVLAVQVGLTAALVVTPYVAWNYATTGHPLPVSGGVKSIHTAQYMAAHDLHSPLSPAFARRVLYENRNPLKAFVSGPIADALWPIGGRLVYAEDRRGIGGVVALPFAALLALLAVGRQFAGLRLLKDRLAALLPLWFVAAFAVANAAVSVMLYPAHVAYAITHWWLVESELVLTVVAATIVVAALHHGANLIGLQRARLWYWRLALAGAAAMSLWQTTEIYWQPDFSRFDWSRSWNDHSYRASQWLARCAPPDARVGSWNAGVLGYHARQRVTNLDGLMNNYALLPYLRDRRIADYVLEQRLRYLSDAESSIRAAGVADALPLREVYREYMPLMRQDYRIYEVLPPGTVVTGQEGPGGSSCGP